MTRVAPRGWKFALAAAFVGCAAFVCTLAAGLFLNGPKLPSFDEVRASHRLSDAVLIDRHGSVIHELRVDPTGRRLDWVALADISPALTRAVVAAEDRRFRDHGGVDWVALAASTLRHVTSGGSRGASTISMQLAARLDAASTPRGPKRTWREKLRQVSAALALERSWSKDEILEAYLNLITFRGELQGIAAASRGLFDKDPSGLGEAESLLLASLIPSSRTTAEAVARRAVRLAERTGSASGAEEIAALAAEVLGRPYRIRPQVALAPHVARMLLSGGGVRRAQCTLDGDLQAFVLEALNRQLAQLAGRNVRDGAALVVDNATGEILAYAANQGITSSAPHVDGIRAPRQAGSTLKPFLYGLAIEKRFLTAASILEDSPLQIPAEGGLYVPENYDREFLGPVSLRTALSASLNIPAVRTLMLVTPEAFVERLRALGMESLDREADYYGYSLALGSADVTLYELVTAYRTLANGGRWGRLKIDAGAEAEKTVAVMDRRAALIVSGILSDREARSATFGLENPLATRYWTAVKTGTSKDMRDNWCVGYSERYTVGVWVGNFPGEPMWNVSGMSGAAPVWLDIMNHLHRRTPSRAPGAVAGIVSRPVSFRDNLEPPRTEWFIEGTEPPGEIAADKRHAVARILYPQPATIITLDPDIPAELQRVSFVGRFSGGTHEWRLDDRPLGSTAVLDWQPQRGRHVLTLVDRENRVADAVSFVVK
ncbi:MAG: penicillin-binding protein 1C [Syntrophaceae bacterium]|nr:penicillin-binding protein 1C [Syntrophaceae bacterium]